MTGNDLVLLGKVVGTHGIRGQLRVAPFSGEFDTLLAVPSIILKGPQGEMDSFAVAAATVHGKKLLVTLKGFANINQVLHLVGRELYVQRAQLPPLEEDEYYWHDLIGLRVVTDTGRQLGRLAAIMETGSNDVYVVREGDREYLIPALADIVVKIDLAVGVMTVSPPEGLLDL